MSSTKDAHSIDSTLVFIDVPTIITHNKLGPQKSIKKRKRFYDDDLVSQQDAHFKSASYLTLANTRIFSALALNESHKDIVDGEIYHQEVQLAFLNDDELQISTKKRFNAKEKVIVRLQFVNSIKQIRLVKKHIKLLRSHKLKASKYCVVDTSPTLIINKEGDKLHIQLSYKFSAIESLYLDLPKDHKTYINDLINELSYTDELPTPVTHEPLSSKVFYDTITTKTSNLPKVQPFSISEMYTDLLPFQTRALGWMLSRESCHYNQVTKSVEDEPFWNVNFDYIDINDQSTDNIILKKINALSFGFELRQLPLLNKSLWYNKYSGNICSKEKALQFLFELESNPDSRTNAGVGLLNEEMGLGKTLEIISLILLHQRNLNTITGKSSIYSDSLGRDIKKSKTNLIICPFSILSQWQDEINLHAPTLKVMIYKGLHEYKTLSPTEVANQLSSHDVVLTTYNVLSREIHNALYNPHRTKRLRKTTISPLDKELELSNALTEDMESEAAKVIQDMYQDIEELKEIPTRERKDHTSPLVLVEFWRLVIDEVQMVGNTMSNVCKLATMIPRFHSWGVSGTPIRNDVQDLHSLISFLHFHPFTNKDSWNSLIGNKDDSIKLIEKLAIRHTKELVKDAIQLPTQKRILLSIPFGPIEQNNYEENYKQFLSDVGLGVDGQPIVENWEPSTSYYEAMRSWLTILRRICCHANLSIDSNHKYSRYGIPNSSSGNINYQTMDKVLKRMILSAENTVHQFERDITVAKLEMGQIHEFQGNPQRALDVWNSELPKVLAKRDKLKNSVSVEESADLENDGAVLRNTLELLHRLYFFIASANFQLYNPPIEQVIPGIENFLVDATVDPKLQEASIYTKYPITSLDEVLFHRALTKQESEYQDLEVEFYQKAQLLRKELLAESIDNVNNAMHNIGDEFEIPLIDPHAMLNHRFSDIDISQFTISVKGLLSELNEQAVQLNSYFIKVNEAMSIPLLDTVTDPSGEEYIASLDDQANASIYLEVIQRAMITRDSAILGKTTNGYFYETVADTVVSTGDNDIRKKLESQLPKLSQKNSLRGLIITSKGIMDNISNDSNNFKYLALIVLELKESLQVQKDSLEQYKKHFRNLNSLYNLKITYFRQLQELSDNVKPFKEKTHKHYNPEKMLVELRDTINSRYEKISSVVSRVRYLKSLSYDTALSEAEKQCAICRNSITIGSLVRCGHKYCKDCLHQWLKNKMSCPICKEKIKIYEVYNFTYNRDTINITMDTEHNGHIKEEGGNEISQIYSKLDEENLENLSNINLKHNYGSKVNTIVRQVLWLKTRDNTTQIVIYSQWTQLLQIIGNALRENGVSFLGSKNTLGKSKSGNSLGVKSDIAIFKKDTSITCFLLNAKADASGLNLINATHVFLCEPFVQTALELQAISRIHRIGQTRPTTVWMFSIRGSVEENIILLSSRKKIKDKEKLDTNEMTKAKKALVGTNGENVETDDLWNSFFSSKMDRYV